MEKSNVKISKKLRAILVILFVLIYVGITYISLRSQYLQYKELGEQYVSKFFTDIKIKYLIILFNFVLISIILAFANRGIKKGLKVFFEQEKREMPKLPNKSLILIVASVASVFLSNTLFDKILLFTSNVSFQETDIIFNLDKSYYMFIKPLIEEGLYYILKLIIGVSAYMALYYIIVFNLHFESVDRELLKNSKLMKKLLRNAVIASIFFALLTIIKSQNIVIGKFLTLSNGVELTGAGRIEATIQLGGYVLLALWIVVAVIKAVKYFKQDQYRKIIYTALSIPAYLVILFVVIVGYDFIFIRPNEFDKEKKYISENINSTKKAYKIDVNETNIDYSGTINEEEIQNNTEIINNITLVNKNLVSQSLEDTQTGTGNYRYKNVSIAKQKINGKEQLVYVAPREINSSTMSFNNKTYEYTHGIGQIIASGNTVTEDGKVQYIQKEITGSDNINRVDEPRIYYGLETNNIAITNNKNKQEYDYTDSKGIEHTYNYKGDSGIQAGFIDRLILAITSRDFKFAISTNSSKESKILLNRNIRERAKKVLPNLLYDENQYTVVYNGQIYWVLDAYTASDKYPYSTFTEIKYEDYKFNTNYIRNSLKVIVNAYNGEMAFYITDRNDPIIMAYYKLYPKIFEETEIPEGIKSQFKYPEFLYNIQKEMLKVYHNVKEDVLYRNNDIWDFALYGSTSTRSKKSILEPYYAITKKQDGSNTELGLIQIYTPNGKSNIISYLVGTCNGTECKLNIYKYPTDSNILGPKQLDDLIEQDETISTELSNINVTGGKISKEMKIIPINDTFLYVETIYQTMTNEPNTPTTLEKVIVASGTKVAIGNTLVEAIDNLLSQSAVNIEIKNMEDVDELIKAIIEANNNLTESNSRNDWSMMGSDIKELQSLIKTLEKVKKQDETQEETNKTGINETETIENTTNE